MSSTGRPRYSARTTVCALASRAAISATTSFLPSRLRLKVLLLSCLATFRQEPASTRECLSWVRHLRRLRGCSPSITSSRTPTVFDNPQPLQKLRPKACLLLHRRRAGERSMVDADAHAHRAGDRHLLQVDPLHRRGLRLVDRAEEGLEVLRERIHLERGAADRALHDARLVRAVLDLAALRVPH